MLRRILVLLLLLGWNLAMAAEEEKETAVEAKPQAQWKVGQKETAEVKLRRLADRLVQGMANMEGEIRYQKFAVLQFDELGERTAEKGLGVLVTSILTKSFVNDHRLYLVEREKLKDILDELALGRMGITEQSNCIKIGQLAGAEALVVGSISDGGDHFLVSARVVSVKDGKTLVANDTVIPDTDLLQIAADALVLRTKTDAAFRSAVVPGWGQYYNKQNLKSAIFLGAEAAILGAALTFHILGERDRSRYDQNLRITVQYKESGEDKLTTRNILLYSAGGFWLLNILDAYLGGYDIEENELWASAGTSSWAVFASPGYAALSLEF